MKHVFAVGLAYELAALYAPPPTISTLVRASRGYPLVVIGVLVALAYLGYHLLG